MQRAMVIRGRLVETTTVELDQHAPNSEAIGTAGVLLRLPADAMSNQTETIIEFVESLPAGVRSKVDIDRQLANERVY